MRKPDCQSTHQVEAPEGDSNPQALCGFEHKPVLMEIPDAGRLFELGGQTQAVVQKGPVSTDEIAQMPTVIPRREDSANSAATAVRHSSSEDSSVAEQETPASISGDQVKDRARRKDHHPTAIAAARAASEGFLKTS